MVAALSLFAALAAPIPSPAQGKPKVLSKLTQPPGGPTRQAFTGTVESLDLKTELLNINAIHSTDVEIFPIKKGVRVSTADGERARLDDLTPGTNVLVYYDQKDNRRTVKEIIVLPASEKTKAPPTS